MRWLALLAAIAGLYGCDADDEEPSDEAASERVERKCRAFIEGLCSQYVRCRVHLSSGEPVTETVCSAALPDAVADCVATESEDIERTSDAAIDACTTAIREQACDLVCNRLPESPAECLALDGYEPPATVTTCG